MIGHGSFRCLCRASGQAGRGMKGGWHGGRWPNLPHGWKPVIFFLCVRQDSQIFTHNVSAPRRCAHSCPVFMTPQDLHSHTAVAPQPFALVRGHRGRVIWFTGLSGAGRSAPANALEVELHRTHKRTYVLDGDNLRRGLCTDMHSANACVAWMQASRESSQTTMPAIVPRVSDLHPRRETDQEPLPWTCPCRSPRGRMRRRN